MKWFTRIPVAPAAPAGPPGSSTRIPVCLSVCVCLSVGHLRPGAWAQGVGPGAYLGPMGPRAGTEAKAQGLGPGPSGGTESCMAMIMTILPMIAIPRCCLGLRGSPHMQKINHLEYQFIHPEDS